MIPNVAGFSGKEGKYVYMSSQCHTVTISNVHVEVLKELGGVGDFLSFCTLQNGGKVTYCGWG